MRSEGPESVGSASSTSGDAAQMRQQHDLPPDVVSDLYRFLMFVRSLVDVIVARGSNKRCPD
jgi:hypothetical protein